MESTSEATSVAKTMPGVFDLIKDAKDIYAKRVGILSIIIGIPIAIYTISAVIAIISPTLLFISLIGIFVSVIIGVYANIALIKTIADPSITDWTKSYASAKGLFWSFIWASLQVTLVIVALLFCLIIPGIYASINYIFFEYTFVLEKKCGWDAAQASHKIVKGKWWAIFGRYFLFILLTILVWGVIDIMLVGSLDALPYVIASGILQIVIAPFIMAFEYSLYKAAKATK